ncbi:MAG TPA: hypothetical protein VEK39_04750 [Solirubrobacterales bacterium]|nr:hypothetical protein [Solirubrobacterales bacterium]
MAFSRRIRAEEAERVLSGVDPTTGEAPELRELASFVAILTEALPQQPDPAVEPAVVARLAEVARSASLEAASQPTGAMTRVRRAAWRRRLVVFARVAFAVALVPAMLAGLAFAGITLPEPAQDAFERLGLELPNQSAVDDGQPGPGELRGQGSNAAHKGEVAEDEDEDAGAGNATAAAARHHGRKHGPRGHGHHGHNGKPQGNGPSAATPPGQGGTPPGPGGVPPGGGSDGSTGPPPSAGPPVTPPGQGGVPPGQAK